MRIGIVIPALDEVEHLPLVLETLGGQLEPDDVVVVVDNGSVDGTPDLVEKLASQWPWLILQRETRRGPGWARRGGAAHVLARWSDNWDGSWIVSCDADAAPAANHLEVWRRHLRITAADLLTGGYRFDESESGAVAEAQPLFDLFARSVGFCERHVGVVNPTGSNHALRPAAYLRIGGYIQPMSSRLSERSSVVAGDDWDLGVRARLAGLRVERIDHGIVASARRFVGNPGGYLAGALHDGAFERVENLGAATPPVEVQELRVPTAARVMLHFLLKPLLVGVGGIAAAEAVGRLLEPELADALVSSVGAGRRIWTEDRDSFIYDLLRSQEPLASAVASALLGSQFGTGAPAQLAARRGRP